MNDATIDSKPSESTSELTPLVSQSGVEDDDNAAIKEMIIKHSETLSLVSSSFKWFYIVGSSCAFTNAMRTTLFISYASNFTNDSTLIAITLYLSYLMTGLTSFIFGIIGDKYVFDCLFIFAATSDVITFFIEATATNYTSLAIAYIVGGMPFEALCTMYNIKMHPIYNAKQFVARFSQYFIIGKLLGYLCGGIIAYYYSYRLVFYISAFLALILFFLTIAVFFNVESKLIEKELEMKEYYDIVDSGNYNSSLIIDKQDCINGVNINIEWIKDRKYRFPICLTRRRRRRTTTDNEDDDNNYSDDDKSWLAFCANCQRYRECNNVVLFIIIFSILCQNFSSTFHTILTVYYVKYMHDRFNESVLITCLQIVAFAVSSVVGAQILKAYHKKSRSRTPRASCVSSASSSSSSQIQQVDSNCNSNNSNNSNNVSTIDNMIIVSILLCCGIYGIITGCILPANIFAFKNKNSLIDMFWICIVICGTCFGMNLVSYQMISIQFIPSKYSGKILGIKMITGAISKSAFLLIVGLLWNNSYQWLFYVQAILCGVIFGGFCIIWLFTFAQSNVKLHVEK